MKLFRKILAICCIAAFAATPVIINAADSKAADTKAAAKTSTQLIDINSATAKQMSDVLPGVGDVTADKIVKGRPYTNKAQLKSKGIVTDSVYEKIQDMIVAKQPADSAKKSNKGSKDKSTKADKTQN